MQFSSLFIDDNLLSDERVIGSLEYVSGGGVWVRDVENELAKCNLTFNGRVVSTSLTLTLFQQSNRISSTTVDLWPGRYPVYLVRATTRTIGAPITYSLRVGDRFPLQQLLPNGASQTKVEGVKPQTYHRRDAKRQLAAAGLAWSK